MRIFTVLLLLLITPGKANSQDYDLIVKSNGDSIACHIDSITVTHIYFEMIIQSYWIHTYFNKADIIEYKLNAVDNKQVVFKSGTSIIEKIRKRSESLFDLQRNSILFETKRIFNSLMYERMFPLDDHIGMILGGGYTFGLDFLGDGGSFGFLTGEAALLLGGPMHNFESGFSLYLGSLDLRSDVLMVRLGYRFQGNKGLLLRPAINFFEKHVLLFSLSIGYSF